ncbi:glycosyltransferase [Thomasclavelia ramosa]|uniref:glycosyltransferase n=1 Tax=Thomasclavelia ramosa TaxID=1547 RepID=UPI00300D98AF
MPGFNSGLMVIEPKNGLVDDLISLIPRVAAIKQSFGDQDVLNMYYFDWIDNIDLHLPVIYNACAYRLSKYTKQEFKVIHYVGKKKPWMWTKWYKFKRLSSYYFRGRGIESAAVIDYLKELDKNK